MVAARQALIPPTVNPLLELALRDKLKRSAEANGSIGELEPLAVRLGLIQNSLRPRFQSARLIVFAADHGLAVDGVGADQTRSTAATVRALLGERLAIAGLARLHGMELTVVDGGVAEPVLQHPRMLARKIAHGTRNSRLGPAMSLEQVHSALRAGMEIGDSPGGSAVACVGLGVGSSESAALVLACASGQEIRDFVVSGPAMDPVLLAHLLVVLGAARSRHDGLHDPVEILAAVGGFEVAMMVGLMLAAASRRCLILPDGLAACAALLVASAMAPGVVDYCVPVRSRRHLGLNHALQLFESEPPFDFGLDSVDGTGATLVWPLIRSAAVLLSEVKEVAPVGAAVALL